MSRPNITDDVVDGLGVARACVLDQRSISHFRQDRRWDTRYSAALEALDFIVDAHIRAVKKVKKAKR